MTTNEYVPSEALLRIAWSDYCQSMDACNAWVRPDGIDTRAEFDRFLAHVRRDAAREALDGLYEDASQEYRIGLQGDDQERMDAAEVVLRATYAWMDNYPEETP